MTYVDVIGRTDRKQFEYYTGMQRCEKMFGLPTEYKIDDPTQGSQRNKNPVRFGPDRNSVETKTAEQFGGEFDAA